MSLCHGWNTETDPPVDTEYRPYRRIALMVLAQAVEDSASPGPEGYRATQWLRNQQDPDLQHWCAVAGVRPPDPRPVPIRDRYRCTIRRQAPTRSQGR